MPEATKNKVYESRKKTLDRVVKAYPPQPDKDAFEAHCEVTGESQSSLITKLMRSFLKAKRDTGQYPTIITLLP